MGVPKHTACSKFVSSRFRQTQYRNWITVRKADSSAEKLGDVTTHADYRGKCEVIKYTGKQFLGENMWPSTIVPCGHINRLTSLRKYWYERKSVLKC